MSYKSILYFTDPHLRDSVPINRKDNFIESQWNKWEELINIAKENNSLILCGGDLFNYWNASYELANKLVNLLIEKDVYIYTIIGNHDIQGYNTKQSSIFKSAIGSCLLSQRVKLLKEGINIFNIDDKEINIYAENVKYNNSDAFMNAKELSIADVILSHNYLIPSSENVKFNFISYESIAQANKTRIFLGSHYHNSSHIVIDNNIFINPGSLTRSSIANKHIPSVVLIQKDLKYDIIPLKSVKCYEDVFELVKPKEELEDVNIEIDLSNIAEGNLEDKILKVAKEKNIKQEILEYILEELK